MLFRSGLPYAHGEFLTNPHPDTVDATMAAYQVYDPAHQKIIENTYVVGWSRKASEGLVGKAKQDAEIGAEAVLRALANTPAPDAATVTERRQAIRRLVEERCAYLVTQAEVALLEAAEQQRALEAQLQDYKFDSNEAMITAIYGHRARMA